MDTFHRIPEKNAYVHFLKCTLLCLLFTVSSPAPAAEGGLSREQAISAALDQAGGPGKVLGVRRIKSDSGNEMFAVKMMVNGRVKVIRIPANTGSN